MEKVAPHAHLTVVSRFESIELVLAVVDDLLKQAELNGETRHWVGLAVREAIANAVKHGSREEEERIRVEATVEDGEVIVRVRDKGPGFDPDELSDPLAPENLLRPSGRGIFYMRKLMDDVEFRFDDDRGTEVVLRKQISSEEDFARTEEDTG
ncbi:MAG: ATP-binding protein [Thermoanaerobaculia bacterium]|nr:ATP-binding protein [Thermoanaerobaculia bacterium]